MTESINQLISLCTQQAPGQKECDNALRELEVGSELGRRLVYMFQLRPENAVAFPSLVCPSVQRKVEVAAEDTKHPLLLLLLSFLLARALPSLLPLQLPADNWRRLTEEARPGHLLAASVGLFAKLVLIIKRGYQRLRLVDNLLKSFLYLHSQGYRTVIAACAWFRCM